MVPFDEPRFSIDLGAERSVCDRLIVGATGAVAVTFLPSFLLIARRNFARSVRVVMSHSAQRFITPLAVRALSAEEPIVDLFSGSSGLIAPHIEATIGADLMVVFPATADILAKVANGSADGPVSATILAATCPVAFVPSMNEAMWIKPAVRRNVARLIEDGYSVMEPVAGYRVRDLDQSVGALPSFEAIFTFLAARLPRFITWIS